MAWTPPAIGARGTWTRTFSAADVEAYAAITGDRNPLHFDSDFAARVRPGALIVHGGLTTGLFNALVAPVVFTGIAEYPLVLVLACFIRRAASVSNIHASGPIRSEERRVGKE